MLVNSYSLMSLCSDILMFLHSYARKRVVVLPAVEKAVRALGVSCQLNSKNQHLTSISPGVRCHLLSWEFGGKTKQKRCAEAEIRLILLRPSIPLSHMQMLRKETRFQTKKGETAGQMGNRDRWTCRSDACVNAACIVLYLLPE